MSSPEFQIEDQGDAQFLVRAEALDDEKVELTIDLRESEAASEGALPEDEATPPRPCAFCSPIRIRPTCPHGSRSPTFSLLIPMPRSGLRRCGPDPETACGISADAP